MIRANLLPVSREPLSVFGATLHRRFVRDAAAGFVFLCLVSGGTYGVEEIRLLSLRTDADRLEQRVAANSSRRREIGAAAADVARLQQLQHEADARRLSGNEVAARLVAIGNAIPLRAWLDGIDKNTAGFAISGGAQSLDDVGDTLVAMGRSLPASQRP